MFLEHEHFETFEISIFLTPENHYPRNSELEKHVRNIIIMIEHGYGSTEIIYMFITFLFLLKFYFAFLNLEICVSGFRLFPFLLAIN